MMRHIYSRSAVRTAVIGISLLIALVSLTAGSVERYTTTSSTQLASDPGHSGGGGG